MHDLQFHLAATFNTQRKVGFFPYLLPRSLAVENEMGEQAVIDQQSAGELQFDYGGHVRCLCSMKSAAMWGS
jgi:hypothetical protein